MVSKAKMLLIATVVALVGALNWGLVALLDFDLVQTVFGRFATFGYLAVGLAGVTGLGLLFLKWKK